MEGSWQNGGGWDVAELARVRGFRGLGPKSGDFGYLSGDFGYLSGDFGYDRVVASLHRLCKCEPSS
jgi:hypothetical protein